MSCSPASFRSKGETAVAVAFKQVAAEPRPPSELNPAVPLSLDAIVLQRAGEGPGGRFTDADELIAALQLEREILPAQTAMTTVMGTEGTNGAGGAPLLAPPAAIDEARTPEEERDRRRRILLWSIGALVAIGVDRARGRSSSAPNEVRVTVPTVTGETRTGRRWRHSAESA